MCTYQYISVPGTGVSTTGKDSSSLSFFHLQCNFLLGGKDHRGFEREIASIVSHNAAGPLLLASGHTTAPSAVKCEFHIFLTH